MNYVIQSFITNQNQSFITNQNGCRTLSAFDVENACSVSISDS